MKRNQIIISIGLLLISTQLTAFNFLVNIVYSILPQPVRSAFKGEGLQVDQFEYGFGNCNFSSFGYLNSKLEHKEGTLYHDNFQFTVPTYYLYGGYIAHVSTPMLTVIYPGWQLETEVGYGGVRYNPTLKDKNQQLFVTGTSGFNWRIFKSVKFTSNILTGYKLHYILKDLLYYGIQAGYIISNRFSFSCEYYTTYKGGNFFIFSADPIRTETCETHYSVAVNFVLSKKYLIKLNYVYKQWYKKEYKEPTVEEKLDLYGFVVSLISK